MSDIISKHDVNQYTTNVEMLLQQMGSRFEAAVTNQSFRGKAATVVEQFGSVSAHERTTRYDDTPLTELDRDRRWVYPKDEAVAFLFDDKDKLRQIVDPKNPHAMAGASAMKRAIDDRIIAGMFGSNNTGENGEVPTGILSSYNSGSQVIAASVGGASSGLNSAKLKVARQKLLEAEVDLDVEMPYIAITAKQHTDLMNEVEATSKEFNRAEGVIESGRIRSFLGFNIILSERIPGANNFAASKNPGLTGYTKGSQWLIPCWVPSAVCLATWEAMSAAVTIRSDKNNMEQLLLKHTIGATRLQEKKVVLITCN